MSSHHRWHVKEKLAAYRHADPAFSQWANGYGVITHSEETQIRIVDMANELLVRGVVGNKDTVFSTLSALDKLCSLAMWLVVTMAYVQRPRLDGAALHAEDFKASPQGHVGGSLNMVPAYCGYLGINALMGITRGWVMGQGHCVAAIDACNVLIGNMTPQHADRYSLDEQGIGQLCQDFYRYEVTGVGSPVSPLGSHVNVHTAGGISEGGYLGFTELQYVHMPLPGERLVAFLSDGAFEEQRGSDWAARWWRAQDSGLVVPVMIANGRRIEQRSTMAQQGGVPWLTQHLQLNGFDVVRIDGRDPAAFVWAIWEMESRLEACANAVRRGEGSYPIPLHYVIAEAPKGFGFPGAGTNLAHNLPLGENPATNESARSAFNTAASALFVPTSQWQNIREPLRRHKTQQRPLERDHAMTRKHVTPISMVPGAWSPLKEQMSPMQAIDSFFVSLVKANPSLRVRIGNPDELASNRMQATLQHCKHRVFNPEPGLDEAIDGAIITALNEEAVAGAALANKGGINLVVSYEAFAVKMLGLMRQEIIFVRHQKVHGVAPAWHAIPFLLTSHTWENGKNEQSHQDPTLVEALWGEMSDTAVVRFPADANSAIACMRDCYQKKNEIHALVVPKTPMPVQLSAEQSEMMIQRGALRLSGAHECDVEIVVIGAFQLQQSQKAAQRLGAHGIQVSVTYLLEPARFREPRDKLERQYCSNPSPQSFGNPSTARIFVSHTRPEPIRGLLRQLDTGRSTAFLGYLNHGGTFDTSSMLFANRCSWLHIVARYAELASMPILELLSVEEREALNGVGNIRDIVGA